MVFSFIYNEGHKRLSNNMKIRELENLEFENSYLCFSDATFVSMPVNIMTESTMTADDFYHYRLRIFDHEHFTTIFSHVPADHTIILEDNNQKYVISGDFARKV
jgi:hypothetical protein